MAKLVLEPPMPRMLRISPDSRTWTREIPLAAPVTLREFLMALSRDVSPLFAKTITRDAGTFFQSVRIAVDRSFTRSDEYDVPVMPDSTVTIMGPYLDG